jgi:hypothetical protein
MRTAILTLMLVLAGLLAASQTCLAAGKDTPPPASLKSATLVKDFAPADMPSSQPDRSEWESGIPDKWAYDIACRGNAVYAVSAPARRLVRFDLSTGTMQFKEAIHLRMHDKESGAVTLHIRTLADGSALLYVFFSTHHETSLLCFAVDAKTGGLTLKGQGDLSIFPTDDVGGGYGYPATVWSPDQNRLYYVGVKKILCYTFDATGLPVLDGKGIAATNPGKSNRGRGHAIMSPDGRQLYVMVEKMEPAGKVFWQADTYDCDPKAGGLTFNSALDLPALPADACNEFLGFAPDGKTLYLVDESAACYYALSRDPAKGTLSILTSGKPNVILRGVGGPPWARGGKFAISADGKSAFYVGKPRSSTFGSFAIDPATGAWSDFTSIPGSWTRMAFDPATGNIFLVGGERISFYRAAASNPEKAGH